MSVPSDLDAQRRLRLIDDSLSGNNYRQVVKLTSESIAKHPGWISPKIRKALALLLMSKRDEADPLIVEVREIIASGKSSVDLDDIEIMMNYCDETMQIAESAEFCNACWMRDQNSIVLGQKTFGRYILAGDFAAAQRGIARLQKRDVKNADYPIFSILCNVLQIRFKNADRRLSVLASAMVKKQLTENGKIDPEMARLFLVVLCDAGDGQTVSEAMAADGVLGKAFKIEAERLEELGNALNLCGAVEEARETYRKLLEQEDDENWMYWTEYIRLAFHSGEAEVVRDCYEVVQSTIVKQKERKRGHHAATLAKLEFEKRRRSYDNLYTSLTTDLPETFADYFSAMLAKPICSENLEIYYGLLAEDEKEKAWKAIERVSADGDRGSLISLCRAQKELTKSGLDLDMLMKLLSEEHISREASTESLSGANASDLVALIVRSRYPDPMEDSPAAVLDMLGLVYRSILNDVDNRQLNILAVVLLNRLGVADLSFEILFGRLNVEYVQLLSLSYLVLGDLLQLGHTEATVAVTEEILKFRRKAETESANAVLTAFQKSSAFVLLDFIGFRDRLSRSKTVVQAEIGLGLMSLARAGGKTLSYYKATFQSGVGGSAFRGAVDMNRLSNDEDLDVLKFWFQDCEDSPFVNSQEELQEMVFSKLLIEMLSDIAVLDNFVPSEGQILAFNENLESPSLSSQSKEFGEVYAHLFEVYRHSVILKQECTNGPGEEDNSKATKDLVKDVEKSAMRLIGRFQSNLTQYKPNTSLKSDRLILSQYSRLCYECFCAVHLVLKVAKRDLQAPQGKSAKKPSRKTSEKMKAARDALGACAKKISQACKELEANGKVLAEKVRLPMGTPSSLLEQYRTYDSSEATQSLMDKFFTDVRESRSSAISDARAKLKELSAALVKL